MIDIAVRIIADALSSTLGSACLAVPGGPAIALAVRQTDDVVDDRDPPALVRVDAQDSITLTYPLEVDDAATLTVGFTVSLRVADIPSLASAQATKQQRRRAVLRCERAVARALVRAFEGANGLIEDESVCVMTPLELTIAEPDAEIDDGLVQGTVTAVFPIQDRYVLTEG